MLGFSNYARFVYDGDGSASEEAGPPGSGRIERLFRVPVHSSEAPICAYAAISIGPI